MEYCNKLLAVVTHYTRIYFSSCGANLVWMRYMLAIFISMTAAFFCFILFHEVPTNHTYNWTNVSDRNYLLNGDLFALTMNSSVRALGMAHSLQYPGFNPEAHDIKVW